MHAYEEEVVTVGGNPGALGEPAKAHVDEILKYYGSYTGLQLRALSHKERPWLDARAGLPSNRPSTAPVHSESMRAYYTGRPCGGGAPVTDLSNVSEQAVIEARQAIDRGEFKTLEDLYDAVLAS